MELRRLYLASVRVILSPFLQAWERFFRVWHQLSAYLIKVMEIYIYKTSTVTFEVIWHGHEVYGHILEVLASSMSQEGQLRCWSTSDYNPKMKVKEEHNSLSALSIVFSF